MSSNSSSSFNASLLAPHLSSSNSSVHPDMIFCFKYRSSFLILTAFSVTNILLLLPLCILVLYLGVQRWRRQRSTAASHSDIFTYHMVAMELIGIFGCALYCCAAWVDVPRLLMTGMYILSVAINGQIPFHILTCVERYLAVVHPISYLGLRERGGVRIRNVSIGCVWVCFFGLFGTIMGKSSAPYFCISFFSIAVISFCSLSVLCALIRPGPGQGGGDRERVDRSKMRAFHIIMTIMGAHVFHFGGHLIILSVYDFLAVSEHVRCDVLLSGAWFALPSSLVLLLLFLHRAGKLLCCKNSNESGRGSE